MPDLYEVADRFRADLLRQERQAATELVRAYGVAWQRIQARIEALGQTMLAAMARGEAITPAWLFQFDRLVTLQREVEMEIAAFARVAETRIVAEQAMVVRAAQEHAEQLALAGLGEPPPGVTVGFTALNAEAVRDLVGFLSDGSPLRSLLDELGPEASRQVREALIAGVATGQHPTAIARQIRQALGGNLVRALTIARTEMLRSYRAALLRSYQQNSKVITGWVWYSALGTNTCAFCWSMHGSFHRLEERFASHPRCRCTPIPKTKTWQELGQDLGVDLSGVPETRGEVEPGPAMFARLPASQQRAILGPAKFAAYQAGAIRLEDLRGFRRDPRWGSVGYERSLREILGTKDALRWQQRGRRGSPSALAGGAGPALSQHPVDRLIRDLVRAEQHVTAPELRQMIDRIAQAPFPTASQHLAKRIAEGQWTVGSSVAEYLADLRTAVQDPGARLLVYQRRGGSIAAVLADTNRVVPPDRRGAEALPLLYVVYSADRGILVTGYQASSVATLSIPEGARWLK